MSPTPATPALPRSSTCHFCTYFDRNYLTRGLALYSSLRHHCRRPFVLWVLCFDDEVYAILARLNLDGIRAIRRQDFEAGDPALAAARTNRSDVEYYWTCTPSLPLYLLDRHPDIEVITYLDADLFFFGDPQPIYDEFAEHSILIHSHRYAPEYAYNQDTAGIYNVGLLVFRRDAAGLECLHWWRARCNEWCHARHEDGKFGDQKYLDDWPERFSGVHVLENPGAGLAPWNLGRYQLRFHGGDRRVDGVPLIFFHFHALKVQSRWLVMPSCEGYRIPASAMCGIYAPYLESLRDAARVAGVTLGDFAERAEWTRSLGRVLRQQLWFNGPRSLAQALWYIGGKIRERERPQWQLLPRWRGFLARRAQRHRESHALLQSAIITRAQAQRPAGAVIWRALAMSPPILLSGTFRAAAARYILGNARIEAWKDRLRRWRAGGS